MQNLPKRVPLRHVVGAGQAVLLEHERKRFVDQVHMVMYRVETELLGLVEPHYARSYQEGRTLVRAMLRTPGDLEVTETGVEVQLRALAAPRHTRAMAALCQALNERDLHFPGTNIRLHFAVQDPACFT